ncbi:MAG TPA: hypothetical protein VH478_17800 [Trebonia sp.]|jgi:flavin-dependent dehydrogenase|nr:hypothetical protein [Trebonia sp.]
MRQHHVELVEGCTVTGLTGTKRRVTGVPARRRDADGDIVIDADLVVDATGRSAKTPRWLQELGLPPTTATTIDAGIGYASRVVAVAHPEDWLSPFVTGLASACRQ